MTDQEIVMRPIGVIHTPHADPSEAPRQGVHAPETRGTVELLPEFADGLDDCEGICRLILIWAFHRSDGFKIKCVPPHDDQPRGVFATRSPRRPNPIGITVVELLERRGNVLEVAGVDMVDGTPLLDIKPYIPQVDAHPESDAGWLSDGIPRR